MTLHAPARYSSHASFVLINGLCLLGVLCRVEIARRCDEPRRRAAQRTLLSDSRCDGPFRFPLIEAPLADAAKAEYVAASFKQAVCHRFLVADTTEEFLLGLWRRIGCSFRGDRVDMLEPACRAVTAVSLCIESARLVEVVGGVLLGLTVEKLAIVPLIAASWCIATRSPS